MSIKRFTCSADSTITNAFKSNLITRGSDANMGAADVLEVFTIYGQATTSSIEESRAILKFPITDIQTARTAGRLPASGNVNFILRMFNVEHSETLPFDYDLEILALTKSWDEGYGLDLDNYSDKGTGSGGFGVTWLSASTGPWDTAGGDVTTSAQYKFTFHVTGGIEDVEQDITNLVEDWISSVAALSGNNGIEVRIHPDDSALERSFYTKKFFSRSSEFFFKKPIIEARWDSSKKDNSGNFYLSSSVAPAEDNLNTLYLYNIIKGQKKNIPSVGTNKILLSVYTQSSGTIFTLPAGGGVVTNNDTNVTGGWVETGVYSASFAFTGSSETIVAIWHSGSTQFFTSSAITVLSQSSNDIYEKEEYVTKITNLKPIYLNNEVATFRVFIREKDWSPTIYSIATAEIEPTIINDGYYKIIRLVDNYEVVSYGTGSTNHTLMSFDKNGNYFDFDMSMLEPDFAYGIKLLYKVNDEFLEQKEIHNFRVE